MDEGPGTEGMAGIVRRFIRGDERWEGEEGPGHGKTLQAGLRSLASS